MPCEIGMLGLGVMGRNLLLNMNDHGISGAGYDLDKAKVATLREIPSLKAAETIQEFIALLRKPRVVMLLVPAGAPVDAAISSMLPYLEREDLIIDGGNSYYKDTDRRSEELAKKGLHFFGVGISGGAKGARTGPSIMPGGTKEGYERIRPIFESVAAKVNGDPCVAYLGPRSAGHYVKMVHNGIEYGLMQLISETYDLMRRGLGMTVEEMHAVYQRWNSGELNSYLLEITSKIFTEVDEKTKKPLIDEILDVAQQKGTGMWTSQSGMELQVPIPTIDIAVVMRDLSMREDERQRAGKMLPRPILQLRVNKETILEELRQAFYASMIVIYAQGMALLQVASEKFNYSLNLETIARIWRGGCIIRAKMLENIRRAYLKEPNLPNLLLDPEVSQRIMDTEESLRHIVCVAAEVGIPAPGFMTILGYIDGYRSAWLPANLIQAQRDFFGSHTYARIDAKGAFHTEWEKEEK